MSRNLDAFDFDFDNSFSPPPLSANFRPAVASRELPPTPAESEVTECQELDLEYGLPLTHTNHHADQFSLNAARWREHAFTSVTAPQEEDMLVMPWIADGTVCRLSTVNGPQVDALPAAQIVVPNQPNDRAKRPISPDEFTPTGPPAKAAKQSVTGNAEIQEQDDLIYGEPHRFTGYDFREKCCCSCGKSYKAKSSLDRHIRDQSGTQSFACSICGEKFARKDVCRRHEESSCKNKKLACPCCRKDFRKDYLREHLSSRANVQCQIFVEALQLSSCGSQAGSKVADVVQHYWSQSAKTWKYGHSRYPSGSSLFNMRPSAEEKISWEPSLRKRPIPQRPIQRSFEEPCDLCGEKLGLTERELVAHHMRHMQSFAAKAHRCSECELSFAHKKDLDRHLQAAAQHYCGLNFNHHPTANGSTLCSGHHPSENVNHMDMQLCIWNWELCQLHAHRATIVRILADRLAHTKAAHASLNEKDLDCMAFVRWSIASLQSFHSAPPNLEHKDQVDTQSLAADFEGLLEEQPPTAVETTPMPPQAPERTRPDSIVIGHDRWLWTTGSLPVIKMQAGYVDRVRALRSPGVADTKPSGIRRYAAQVNRRLFSPGFAPDSRILQAAAT